MSEKNSLFISFSLILSISLAACAMTALLISRRDETAAFRLLNGICAQVLELEPEAAPVLQKALKEYHSPAGRGDTALRTSPPFLPGQISALRQADSWPPSCFLPLSASAAAKNKRGVSRP